MPARRPRVSVLMAVYNGDDLIQQSVDSILAQSFTDFEFIIVDDCSTDRTPDLLARYCDPRLKVLRNKNNLGVVEARNRGFAQTCGEFIAILDHDDLSRPARFAEQVALLDRHPEVALVSTSGMILEAGRLRPFSLARGLSPIMLRWMLHFRNPIIFSSVMVRAAVVRDDGTLLRRERELAEDYDLYFRALRHGDIAQIDEPMAVYRVHGGNISRRRREMMILKTGEVLADVYREWLGADAEAAGQEVARHVAAGDPVADWNTLDRLGTTLERIADLFFRQYRPDAEEGQRMRAYLGRLWWQVARNTLRAGHPGLLGAYKRHRALCAAAPPSLAEQVRAVAAGSVPARSSLRRLLQGVGPRKMLTSGARGCLGPGSVFLDRARAPTLCVVVDTRSPPLADRAFAGPMPAGDETAERRAGALLASTQAVFDRYGIRPVYLVDAAIASNPVACVQLAAIVRRGAASLALEAPAGAGADDAESGLAALSRQVADTLGTPPLFCVVHGKHGATVDIEMMRRLNLRGCFDADGTIPRLVLSGKRSFLFLPLASDRTGLLAGRRSLTTDDQGADRQNALLRSLLRSGYLALVLRHICPLDGGGADMDGSGSGGEGALARLEALCRCFFGDLGGMPGDPLQFLPPDERGAPAVAPPEPHAAQTSLSPAG